MKINHSPRTAGTGTPGTVIEKIDLENGQALVLSDLTRKISPDACVVIMQASMEITLSPDLFKEEPLSGLTFDEIIDTLGEKVVYEYRLERNFIMDHEKEDVLTSLVDTFKKNTRPYISHPRFAPKLVLKQYRDRQ